MYRIRNLLLLLGIISPITAYTSISLAIINAPWFSWRKNALSDLGVWGNSAIIFNSGLMISAITQIAFIVGLSLHYTKALSRAGSAVYLLASIMLFLIGLYPESAGKIHFYVSLLFFILTPTSLIVLSASLIKEYGFIRFGLATLLIAILSFSPWLIPWRSLDVRGVAIPELLSTIPVSAWNIYVALKLIVGSKFKIYFKSN